MGLRLKKRELERERISENRTKIEPKTKKGQETIL